MAKGSGISGSGTTVMRALALLSVIWIAQTTVLAASKEDRVFTIGNYPLEARDQNAVAAKDRAIAEGQQAAFRSLLKRIVPVTSYKHLGQLKGVKAAGFIESFAVRSERNSSTACSTMRASPTSIDRHRRSRS
jgi:hypothetical protein